MQISLCGVLPFMVFLKECVSMCVHLRSRAFVGSQKGRKD